MGSLRTFSLVSVGVMLVFGCKPAVKGGASIESSDKVHGNEVAANIRNWEDVPASQLPKADAYKLVLFPKAEIAANMTPGRGENGVPHSLDGIWWTDGDAFPIKALTLAHAAFNDPQTKRSLALPVFDAGCYTYVGDASGANFFQLMVAVHLIYEINFSADYQHSDIVPLLNLAGRTVKVPTWLAEFTMDFHDDGLWTRKSSFFKTQVPDYQFTRIITADGQQDHGHNDAFQRYLDSSLPNTYKVVAN